MISIISTARKGGCGKSGLAANLAAILAEDRRVLRIDLDNQGDASTFLDIEDRAAPWPRR
jgi:cellulose biosynthesis protein BcsQ